MKRFKIGEIVRVRRHEVNGEVIEKIGSGRDKRYRIRMDIWAMLPEDRIIVEHPDLLEHLSE